MGIGSSGNGGVASYVAVYSDTWTGAWVSPQSVTMIGQRYGNLVNIDIYSTSAEGQASTSAQSSAGILNSEFRPLANVFTQCAVISNDALVATPGKCVVTTAGSLIIYFDATEVALWSGAGGANGWQRFSISYFV